ncbi:MULTISPECIES: hypothetical protein [unclassified Granulicatella]|uniref:hypothetical protein n=1 Tax=unclassified Granulicatella TaxID=2630493 RepID=UPI001073DEE3|nr:MULTISPECIES: hypothetical protein [unclassified Granulicatella]MBF0780150.1 hypothetical protein [Granulicatella sp. 19428wC4_WM01]TFU95754.1 hypothetical protein E4T68_03485 [Granulicatella sp. WM01]
MNKKVRVLLASVALLSTVATTLSVSAQDNDSIPTLQNLKNKEDEKRLAAALQTTIDAENNARDVFNARLAEHQQVLNVYNTTAKEFEFAEVEYKKVRIEASQDIAKETAHLNELIAVGNNEIARIEDAIAVNQGKLPEANAAINTAKQELSSAEQALEDGKNQSPQVNIRPLEAEVQAKKGALEAAEKALSDLHNFIDNDTKLLGKAKVDVKNAENKRDALNIDDNAAVRRAKQAYEKALEAYRKAADKLSVTRANLDRAVEALNEAIKQNRINHLKNGVEYQGQDVAPVEKTDAEKEAEEVARTAEQEDKENKENKENKEEASQSNQAKPSVASTPTGEKVLPKTSAVK